MLDLVKITYIANVHGISYDRSEICIKIHQNFCIFLFSIVENIKITKIQQNWEFENSCPEIIVTKFDSIKKRVLNY